MILEFFGYGFFLPLISAVILCRVMRRKLGWLRSRERKPGKEKIHRLFPRPRRPLSGGLAILIALTLGVAAQNLFFTYPPQPVAWYFLGLIWAFGLIGLADDLQKTGGRGLSEREKLIAQVVVALGFSLLLQYSPFLDIRFGRIHVPFTKDLLDLGIFYPIVGMLVIVAASNAVNLTDGMDGLASGQMLIAAFFMMAVCGLFQAPLGLEIFLSLIAACLGFLVFNYPPARLLMGDMGSLALGAALGGGAMLIGAEAFLPLAGAVFVINTLSVIIQVTTVRWLWRIVRFPRQRITEPFRPFLCTPLHHHFQWLGWREKSILRLFWGAGTLFGGIAILSVLSGWVWLLGTALLPVMLLYAAFQKMLSGSYFIGVIPVGEGPARLALFQGQPAEVLGRRLYRLLRQTSLSESVLLPGASEGLLWRPMSEIEARVALGSLFAQQHMSEEALAEWEEIPVRNLLLRENVVMQLARLYYSRDRLLEAIRLWEALPRTRFITMPNLQEIVRAARLRLAELASKSYRQCMAVYTRMQSERAPNTGELSRQLTLSLNFNNDLLSLLITFHPEIPAQREGSQEWATSDMTYRRVEKVLRDRIKDLEKALAWCTEKQKVFGGEQANVVISPARIAEQTREFLGFSVEDIQRSISDTSMLDFSVAFFQPNPKASRNAIARLGIYRTPSQEEPEWLVAKSYREERIAFFSACYRRERALLEMLSSYGCPVPKVRGGLLRPDRALLLMEDGGTENLAERLERLDATGRENVLTAAVTSLAVLHRQSSLHLPELQEEVRKIDKEVLTPQYHVSAFRIALERIVAFVDSGPDSCPIDIEEALSQYQPIARLLSARPETFIHFEFTPHHLLTDEERLTIFDFEQATVGPAEFDLACLLNSPEAGVSEEATAALIKTYQDVSGIQLDARALDYAILAKNLTYAGAAVNFYQKHGGDYHLQRLEWYLGQSLSLLEYHPPLGPLRRILSPVLDQARKRCLSLLSVSRATPEAPAADLTKISQRVRQTLRKGKLS